MELAVGGRTQYVIALADQPSDYDRQAASDLSCYLGKMTAAEFKVVPESQVSAGQKAVFVGQTDFARKADIDFGSFTAEEWLLKRAGDNLILSGGKPIGSFYAAWKLLNRLGCYALTLDQDAIPECQRLTIDSLDERGRPAFDGRMVWDGFGGYFIEYKPDKSVIDAYRLWKLRNGINGRQYSIDKGWCYSVFAIPHEPQFHSFSLYVNPALFDSHPEYFWMNGQGKRLKPLSFRRRGSLCMSNREMANHLFLGAGLGHSGAYLLAICSHGWQCGGQFMG